MIHKEFCVAFRKDYWGTDGFIGWFRSFQHRSKEERERTVLFHLNHCADWLIKDGRMDQISQQDIKLFAKNLLAPYENAKD